MTVYCRFCFNRKTHGAVCLHHAVSILNILIIIVFYNFQDSYKNDTIISKSMSYEATDTKSDTKKEAKTESHQRHFAEAPETRFTRVG